MDQRHKNSTSLRVAPLGYQGPCQRPFGESFCGGRSNLTALSQSRNLYFVAISEFICVYRPSFPDQKLQLDKPVATLRPAKTGDEAGYLIPNRPHCINYIITEFIGNQEILLSAHDDGDVFAYWIEQIDQFAETQSSLASELSRHSADSYAYQKISDQHDVNPWLKYNVEQSAWGLAVHRRTRKIAVTSNTTRITVLVLALASPSGDDDSSSAITNRTTQVIHHVRETRQNLPCVSFANFKSSTSGTFGRTPQYHSDIRSLPRWPSYNDDANSNSLLAGNIVGHTFLWEVQSKETNPFGESSRREPGMPEAEVDYEEPQRYHGPESELAEATRSATQDAAEDEPELQEAFVGHRCFYGPKVCSCFGREGFPHAVWGLHLVDPKWFRDDNNVVAGEVEASGHWELRPEADGAAAPHSRLGSGQFKLHHYDTTSQSKASKNVNVSVSSYPILQMTANRITLYLRSDPVEPTSEYDSFSTVSMDFMLQDLRYLNPFCDRFVHHALLPDLGLFLAGSLNGRVAIFSLEKVRIQPHGNHSRTGENGQEKRPGFVLEQIVPTKRQESEEKRPGQLMLGMSVSPMQGEEVTVNEDGEVKRDWPESVKRRGGNRRYKLMMMYANGAILSYELSRGSQLGVLSFV
jgi:CRT10